jgi:chromodomain-helicase-DNA-binding protein 1
MFNNPSISREDLEAMHIEKERQADQLKGYSQVERIIAQRDAAANEDVDHDHSALSFLSLPSSVSRLMSPLASFAVEYLCKWRGLQYSDATWENHDSIAGDEIAAAAIESFLAREASPHLPAKSANYNKGRPKFVKLTEEPAYVSKCGTLKDFQVVGLNWMAYLWSRGDNGILADEVRSRLALS